MAEYRWDPRHLYRVVAVPAVVAEQHLKLAGPIQLKVLLWLAVHGGEEVDIAACAAAVGYPAADCTDALQYWVQAGVLQTADLSATPAPAYTVPATPAPAETPARAPSPARPHPVKPAMPEVVAEQQRNSEFAGLLDAVSKQLGKPLSPGDMETLLYLFSTVGLPAGVILMVVGYAAQAERFTMRYIEKIALDWADRGILSIAAAEEYLCYLEHCQQALLKVQVVCGLPKPLNAGAINTACAEKWIFRWHISDDLLRLAYEACEQKTGGFQAKYMDRILENWHSQGLTTVEQVQALSAPTRKAGSRPAGEQHTEDEQMVETYTPVYRKKKEGRS